MTRHDWCVQTPPQAKQQRDRCMAILSCTSELCWIQANRRSRIQLANSIQNQRGAVKQTPKFHVFIFFISVFHPLDKTHFEKGLYSSFNDFQNRWIEVCKAYAKTSVTACPRCFYLAYIYNMQTALVRSHGSFWGN